MLPHKHQYPQATMKVFVVKSYTVFWGHLEDLAENKGSHIEQIINFYIIHEFYK